LVFLFSIRCYQRFKVVQSGIPARYGRASSVLDIYQKDGNSKGFHVNGGIGLISSSILAEGPLVKDKGSFLTVVHAHLFLKFPKNKKTTRLIFMIWIRSWVINWITVLFIGLFGRDVFSLNKSFQYLWKCDFKLALESLVSEKLNLSLIYSYYGLDLDFVGFKWDSGIRNYNIKYDFKNYISDKFKLNYGGKRNLLRVQPGTINHLMRTPE
jgi:hypothetical protein